MFQIFRIMYLSYRIAIVDFILNFVKIVKTTILYRYYKKKLVRAHVSYILFFNSTRVNEILPIFNVLHRK